VINVEALVSEANRLEPLPASATRLASILASGDWRPNEVVQVVSHDQALTGKLLKVANSVSNGSQTQIMTVDSAVVRLGTGVVLSLAIGSGFRKQLQRKLPGTAEGDLWTHSVGAAAAAEEIVRACNGQLPGEVMTAALMHDVGKLLLRRHLDDETHAQIEAYKINNDCAMTVAESEIIGISHGEVGALVAQNWRLPETLVRGIHYHHEPEGAAHLGARDRLVCHAVFLADRMAHAAAGGEILRKDLGSSLEVLGVAPERLAELVRGAKRRLDEVLLWYT
jgi:putative nucleotidyltransferase with HDIG domain